MPFLSKYLLFFLLLANMTSEYLLLAPVSAILFYGVLILSIPLLLAKGFIPPDSYMKFPELCIMIFIYIIAQFAFQYDLLTMPNILYTITKVAVFGIMIICIGTNLNLYLKKLPIILTYCILGLIALGWVYNSHTGRYGNLTFGFVNRNVACTIATASFAGFMFLKDKLKFIDYIFLTFLFITVLYGGSRNALAMCILIILVKYGFSFKLIGAGLIMTLAVLYILPACGIEITAFDRLLGTIDGTVSIDREEERDIAWAMIKVRPYTGWGYHYANISSSGLAMNAHNGYLTMIENLGWPCGLSALACIIIGSIKRLKLYSFRNKYINFHLAIIISTLFAANQEDYLIGVNQFTTNMFFLSFAVLGMLLYLKKRGEISKIITE